MTDEVKRSPEELRAYRTHTVRECGVLYESLRELSFELRKSMNQTSRILHLYAIKHHPKAKKVYEKLLEKVGPRFREERCKNCVVCKGLAECEEIFLTVQEMTETEPPSDS